MYNQEKVGELQLILRFRIIFFLLIIFSIFFMPYDNVHKTKISQGDIQKTVAIKLLATPKEIKAKKEVKKVKKKKVKKKKIKKKQIKKTKPPKKEVVQKPKEPEVKQIVKDPTPEPIIEDVTEVDDEKEAREEEEKRKVEVALKEQKEKVTQDYFSYIHSIISSKQKYPRKAKKFHQEGTIKVSFEINKQGEVINFKIVKKSKYKSLNKAVVKLFKKIKTLRPLPPELGEVLEIVVPITYSLTKGTK